MRTHTKILSVIAAAALSIGAIIAQAAAEVTTEVEAGEILATAHYSGEWTKKSFKSSGTWEIFEEDGETFVKLSEDFRTRNGPDLKIFLSPLEVKNVNGRNATDGSVLISALESNAGEQIYKIPADVELTEFQSIIIHCEAYSKLWSASNLR